MANIGCPLSPTPKVQISPKSERRSDSSADCVMNKKLIPNAAAPLCTLTEACDQTKKFKVFALLKI